MSVSQSKKVVTIIGVTLIALFFPPFVMRAEKSVPDQKEKSELVDFLPKESSLFHDKPNSMEDILNGDDGYAAALSGQKSPYKIAFLTLKKVNQISLRFYAVNEFPMEIRLEVKRNGRWVSCPVRGFTPGPDMDIVIDLSSDIPVGSYLRFNFNKFTGQQRLILRDINFKYNQQNYRSHQSPVPKLSSGYLDLENAFETAIYPPTWYSSYKLYKKLDQNFNEFIAEKNLNDKLIKNMRDYLISTLKILSGQKPFWSEKKSENVSVNNGVIRTISIPQYGTETDLYLEVKPGAKHVFLYLPGSTEDSAEALAYLPKDSDFIKEGILAIPTLSHARPGNNIYSEGMSPILEKEASPLGVMTCETVAVIQYLRKEFPDKPVILAGYSIGAELALLAGMEADEVIAIMPGYTQKNIALLRNAASSFPYTIIPNSSKDIFVAGLVASIGNNPRKRVYILDNLGDEFKRLNEEGPLKQRFDYVYTTEPHGPFNQEWLRNVPVKYLYNLRGE